MGCYLEILVCLNNPHVVSLMNGEKMFCYDSAKKNFIDECNIEEMKTKRFYLQLIIKYFEQQRKPDITIPYLYICEGSKENTLLCKYITEEINMIREQSKNINACDNIKNYIHYPFFMALLRIEIYIDKDWKKLLVEKEEGIKSNISYNDSYFKNQEDHIRYPYIALVIYLISRLRDKNNNYTAISNYLNKMNIPIFSSRNRYNINRWTSTEVEKQLNKKSRKNQAQKIYDGESLTNEQIIQKIRSII